MNYVFHLLPHDLLSPATSWLVNLSEEKWVSILTENHIVAKWQQLFKSGRYHYWYPYLLSLWQSRRRIEDLKKKHTTHSADSGEARKMVSKWNNHWFFQLNIHLSCLWVRLQDWEWQTSKACTVEDDGLHIICWIAKSTQ